MSLALSSYEQKCFLPSIFHPSIHPSYISPPSPFDLYFFNHGKPTHTSGKKPAQSDQDWWDYRALGVPRTALRQLHEGAVIQIVGNPEVEPCRYCRSTGGPFVHCVRENGATRCGNCHWRGKECSLNPEEPANPVRHTMRRLNAEAVNAIFDEREALNDELDTLQELLRNHYEILEEVNNGLDNIQLGNVQTRIALRTPDLVAAQRYEDAEDIRLIRLKKMQAAAMKGIDTIKKQIMDIHHRHMALLDRMFREA
ncbi:hypothetical protein PoHVEF18_008678 [Penicillium ochrochloron]